ncbi:hypothetical protein [Amycolatopsis plumensis]|uniref:Uncharacterized protein n=1 Tax=Amycolatopsis plumensis TaxID=236508 RepID=A0ABV5UAN6_9PSEU
MSDQQEPFRPRRDYLPPSQRPLPPGWREQRQAEDAAARPAAGEGCVKIFTPGTARKWLSVRAKDANAPHADNHETETFREAVTWAFEQAPEVYLSEPATGELTKLSPTTLAP